MCTALTMLSQSIARNGKPMSALVAPIARYAQSGEINFQIEDKDAAIAELRAAFGPGSPSNGQMDDMDGVTIDCFKSKGWWCNVRKSNTEPLLRLNLEAKDKPTLDRMLAEIAPRLGKQVDH
jgi:phosphomannomutase